MPLFRIPAKRRVIAHFQNSTRKPIRIKSKINPLPSQPRRLRSRMNLTKILQSSPRPRLPRPLERDLRYLWMKINLHLPRLLPERSL